MGPHILDVDLDSSSIAGQGPQRPNIRHNRVPPSIRKEPCSFFTKSNESITAEWEAPVLDPSPLQVGIVKLFTVELSEIIHFVAKTIITLDTSYIKV